MTPKALKALIATLREDGVCRYRYKDPKTEIELELWQHAPLKAAEAPAARPTEALRAEQAVPKPLRSVMQPGEFAAAVQRARALGVGADD